MPEYAYLCVPFWAVSVIYAYTQVSLFKLKAKIVMEAIAINTQVRDGLGKKATKAMRREGQIPCVLYGTPEPLHFSVTHKDVKGLIFTPNFMLAQLDVDGQSYKAIIKDTQFHPVSDAIQHIDFLALEDGRPVKVALPVTFEGSSPGVRSGGKLQQLLRSIEVKTIPEKLIDRLTLNISKLKLGQSIRVRDIQLEEGIEIMSAPATPVAIVEIPRALRSATSRIEEEADGEETPDPATETAE